jgi:hypothetical protein
MVQKIAKYISQKPFLIQIAKDNVWEKTWNIKPFESLPDEGAIISYLNESVYKNVAIEALFKDDRDKVYILGLVHNHHLKAKTPQDFIKIFISETAQFVDFVNFIGNLDSKIIGQQFLLQGEPDLIRIGIVNHWFSVGPCDVWVNGEPKEISHDLLGKKLSLKPEVTKTNLNYQGMAFLFNFQEKEPGLRHWMKSPCSNYANEFWKLDEQMIFKYLEDWQDFKIS